MLKLSKHSFGLSMKFISTKKILSTKEKIEINGVAFSSPNLDNMMNNHFSHGFREQLKRYFEIIRVKLFYIVTTAVFLMRVEKNTLRM